MFYPERYVVCKTQGLFLFQISDTQLTTTSTYQEFCGLPEVRLDSWTSLNLDSIDKLIGCPPLVTSAQYDDDNLKTIFRLF